jgi:N-acetylmuramoyl-L-alanine amidase
MAPGTCVAFAPSQADRHQVVFIDAGHGGYAPGASGTRSDGRPVLEKNLTLAIALKARDLLRAEGFTVVMSRTTDTTVARMSASDVSGGTMTVAGDHDDIAARVACANSASAALLLNLHFNGSADAGAGGTQTFYDDARRFSAENAKLAQRIQSAVVASLHTAGMNTPDRGTLPDSQSGSPALTPLGAQYNHYLELGPVYPNLVYEASGMPGVIAEMLFVSNPREADIASSPLGQQALARGIARGATDYLGQRA